MRWARLMLAVVLVVGSASVASAECAWVLWDKLSTSGPGTPGTERWVISEAYTTQRECTSARLEGWESLVNKLKCPKCTIMRNWPGRNLAVLSEGGILVMQQYWCLPDTIDPREKKE